MARKGLICPVCGKHRFKIYDFYEVCPVCGWEDDGLQRVEPDYEGGANTISLNQMRKAYEKGIDKRVAIRAYEAGKLDELFGK